MARIPPRSPGFILVVALLALMLAGAVAEMSLRLALSEALAATYEVADERADYIAESGLARVSAYLTEMGRLEPDFDRALDPGLNTTCSYSNAQVVLAGNQDDDHVPPFGGDVSTDPGNRFMKVAYNEGAYYVRIDDNSDDGHEGWSCPTAGCAAPYTDFTKRTNYFPAATNNREGGGPYAPGHPSATSCPEAASVEINALRDNPVRDRDKTVLVTVIGIFPGTDWHNAKARKAYRLVVGASRSNPGLLVGGNLSLGSGTDVCGPQGGIQANGNISLASGVCGCGEVSDSDGVLTGGSMTRCTTPSPCAACAPTPPPQKNTVGIPPVEPRDAKYMNYLQRDANKQCYFYFDTNGVGYFWDHNRAIYNGQDCNAFPQAMGAVTPRPCGAGPNDVTNAAPYDGVADDWCQCWVPVFYDNKTASPTAGYPANPYRSGGPLFSAVSANYAGLVSNNGCSNGQECGNLDAWTPKWTAAEAQNTYDYELLCNGFVAGGHRLWATAGGTTADMSTANTDDSDVPDALYFLDGEPGETVTMASNLGATMSIITPMQLKFTSNVNMWAPTWARNYLMVSGSTNNGLTNSSSCELSSNGQYSGLVLCQGNVKMDSNFRLTGGLVSLGDVTMASNTTLVLDPSLPAVAELPVRPLVWSDAAF